MEETCKDLNKLITYFQKLANNEESTDSSSDLKLNLSGQHSGSISATTTPTCAVDFKNFTSSLKGLFTSNSFDQLSASHNPSLQSQINQLSLNETNLSKFRHPNSRDVFSFSLKENESLGTQKPSSPTLSQNSSDEQRPGMFVMKKKFDDEISSNNSRKRSNRNSKKIKNVIF